MSQKRHAGFTLIELILVIAIIGIVAAIIFAGVALTRSKARDAKRLTDLKAIASTLEFYYSDNGHYPIAPTQVTGCSNPAAANWIPDSGNFAWSNKYIALMPRDPSEVCAGGSGQSYAYQSDGAIYQITTKLENPSPPASSSQTFAFNGSFFQPVVDTTPVGVSFSTAVSNPTNQSPIPIVISFSRGVVDFTLSSLSVASGVVSGFTEVLASLFNVFVTPTDNNTVVVSVSGGVVHDINGVGNAAAQFTITYDSLLPHAALSPDPLPQDVSGPFSLNLNFTVAVTDFTSSKISVSNGSVTSFTPADGSNYSFIVTPAAPGPVTVTIPGGVVHSAAGNANISSNTVQTNYTGQ